MSGPDPEKLSAAERALLERRLLESRAAKARDDVVPRRSGQGPAPASFAQERLWFVEQLAPGSATYHIADAFVIAGGVDVARLGRSLEALVRRHESLRTTFALEGGRPVQIVGEPFAVPLEEQLLADVHEPEEAQPFLVAESHRPFDLEAGPLFRARLFRLGSGTRVFLLVMHHIISDGVSLSVFFRELAELHDAQARGRSPLLTELSVQYADFAAWQRERIGEAGLEKKLAYWREQLADLAVLELPAAGPRRAGVGRGAVERVELSLALTQGLREQAKRARVTPFMLTLAAFELLLARYSGQKDLAVGSPAAGRDREELEGLIGCFVNMLVLRADLAGEPTVRELLARVRETTLAAFDHQDVPFGRLVDELAPDRDLTRNPLFQVTFQCDTPEVRNEPSSEPSVETSAPSGTLALQPIGLELGTTRFDLELRVFLAEEGSVATLTFDADLFDPALVRRMLGHYGALLEGLVEALERDPERPAFSLAMPGTSERALLLGDWSRRPPLSDELAGASVHGIFESRALERPAAIALEYEQESLTYGELDRRANQLAHELALRGVGPETSVGLCMERSPDLIVAMLAVLKAGGTYVPLDPEFPAQRLALMVEDVRPLLMLVHERLRGNVPELGAAADGRDAVVCIDRGEERARIAAQSTAALGRCVDAAQIAHVLFTSGSTGRPKGVPLPHRGIVRLTQELHSFQFEASDVVTQVSNAAFDAATYEIWSALLNGARLVIVPREVSLAPASFAEELRRREVTVVFLATALLNQMLDARPDSFGRLRGLLFGGEAADAGHLRSLLSGRAAGAGPEHLINLYGPTENSTLSTWFEVRSVDEAAASVPIGGPVSHSTVYLLDENLQPVPIGAPGEVCVGGEGLARGYLGNPALTAERFVPDPFSGALGARIYRTGDLAFRREDGEAVFLGRGDQQVKLRGFRIELGEIETALTRLDSVRTAVVVARRDGRGIVQLVAYVVPTGAAGAAGTAGATTTGGELRRELRKSLPDYMVPAAFVLLDALPLTPNGKIDQRALPDPEGGRDDSELFVAPRGQVEEQVAAIWRDVLELEQVGVHDNFFDLGGHSLRLVQVHTRLGEELGAELSMTDLFQFVTVASLAERLEAGAGASVSSPNAASRRGRLRGERRAARGESTAVDAIAVVAVAGRFPGAADVEAFWENLAGGVESIRVFSKDELRAAGIDGSVLEHPDLVKARPVLDDVELFDARYFGYTPREAELMDPQQRLFLECAVEALERAGCDPARFDGAIGVYAGSSENTYDALVRTSPDHAAGAGLQGATGRGRDFLPTRVSYELDLCGPSINVQTACSSSLVAVHLACRALAGGECDLALAGGVALSVPVVGGYFYQEGDIYSRDGHCRAFDAAADGTLRGDGLGIVVLKRLADAERDGDTISAIIRGSAVNNDGRAKIGFVAPSLDGQAEVVATAQAAAGVEPDTVSYVEAHGIASRLGDPIEVTALTRAFRERTERTGFCALGSLKSNMGHLDAASGVAALIKTVLALEHGALPPSLHFDEPNPEIDFEASPFFVNTELRPWSAEDGAPLRAGVSNFGIGGTNAHVVLEEAPVRSPSDAARGWQLLTLSAKTEAALETLSADLRAWLGTNTNANLADVAWTLQLGRRQHELRRVIRCRDVAEARSALGGERPELVHAGQAASAAPVPSTVAADPVALADAWVVGGEVDWAALHGDARRQRLRLPTYPFERQRYWVDSSPAGALEVTHGTPGASRAADRGRHPRPDLESEYVAPRNTTEEQLCAIWQRLFGFDRIGVHDNWFELGGDSVLGIQVVARARDADIALTPTSLYEHQSVAELASSVGSAHGPGAQPVATAQQGPVVGPVELTPIQHWFFKQDFADAHHFNQSNLLDIEPRLVRAAWERVVGLILSHHDLLRSRYRREDGVWQQRVQEPGSDVPLEFHELSNESAERQRALISEGAAGAQASLDLVNGPIARFVVFDLGAGRPQRLFVVVHHLVVDIVSWPVIAEDLRRAAEQLGRGEEPRLPPKTMSLQAWSRGLQEYAQSTEVARQFSYWTALPWDGVRALPVDRPGGANTAGSCRSLHTVFGESETRRLLTRVTRAGLQLPDALLAAVAIAFTRWTESPAFLVDVEGHGRESLFGEVDLTRSVGWFTAMYPMLLRGRDLGSAGAALAAVAAAKRALPDHGLGHGLLRYLNRDDDVRAGMAALPEAEVVLLYLGNQGVVDGGGVDGRDGSNGGNGSADAEPALSFGDAQSPRARRSHLLEIQVSLSNRCLHTTWNYSGNLHEASTIRALDASYQAALVAILGWEGSLEEHAPRDERPEPAPRRGLWRALLGLARRARGAPRPDRVGRPGPEPAEEQSSGKFELAGLDEGDLQRVRELLEKADQDSAR